MERGRIAIAGAGIVGLACAFELYRRGHEITLFDAASPTESTSWAAAGMIAPAYEVMLHRGGAKTPLARFCFESAALWPEFAEALRVETGIPFGYARAPTLAIARNDKEADRLVTLKKSLIAAGHICHWRHGQALPGSLGASSEVQAALELPDDHQVDNRHLIHALRSLCDSESFRFVRAVVNTQEEMERYAGNSFDAIIWARGAHEVGIDSIVKGQALALYPVAGVPEQVLRFGAGYIVPKPDRVIIGATSEETYSHTGVSQKATKALFEEAVAILPILSKAKIMEVWTGLRPRRGNGVPLIGSIGENEYVAAGLHRNGVLLAPATARRVADLVEGKPSAIDAEAFAPSGNMDATA